MIHLLALLARAGHGKTTTANHLSGEYGTPIVSLASPLKRIAQVTMGFSDAQLFGTQEEKEAIDPRYGMSARVFLQKLGTEGIRQNLGPLTWCEALAYNTAQDAKARGYDGSAADLVYVVDDVRFPNEAEFLQSLKTRPGLPAFFGTVIKLVCTDAPPSGNDNHPSERGVDEVPAHMIDAVVTSSRAQGTAHLIEQFEDALTLPHLANVRGALNRQRYAAAAERAAERRAARA